MTDPRQARADALVDELRRQGAGRLTLFLGAAPGVGKTFAMLRRARELREAGTDVVAGIVETHGRAETAALLQGLEVLLRRRVEYLGHTLEELDIDTLLARRPTVALVDELAHRNAPGSRHERRWQDVLELLDAGIDVHTTLNVQHLESLNDIVHRITGVRVTETVPDAIFARLRDIILVDLPPRELIQRLREGKVYLPEQASRAMQAYFTAANLAALRELAMQTAADRVDNDLRETRVARGLPGVSLRRGVLVAIDGLGQSDYMVRVGRRIAERRAVPWTVVYVQRGAAPGSDVQAELDRAFELARRLGGKVTTLHNDNIVNALLDHAGQFGANAIVLGRTREHPFARTFNRTLTQQLLQRAAHLELTIVRTPADRSRSTRRWPQLDGNPWRDVSLAFGGSAIATALSAVAEHLVGLDDLSMVYIVAVVVVAARSRMRAAVLTSVLCFLAYNFFFIEPRFTFYISAQKGITTVFLFLLAALVSGRLASKLRTQVQALRAANAHTTALEDLGRALASAADLGQVALAGQRALQQVLGIEARVLMQDAPATATEDLDERDRAAADWALRHRQPAGRFTDTLGNARWWFLPLSDETGPRGVAGLHFDPGMPKPSHEQRRLAEAMTDMIGQAVQRVELVADLADARISGESERLRSALLSSVSHDLRSPLAAIIGAAGSLENYADAMDQADRHALLDTIRVEGERLDRYIQNLLDMTRLGHGGLALNRDWIGVDEIIGSALGRLRRYAPEARFEIRIDDDLPPLWVHPALVEQALFNVIENAMRFSPDGFEVAARRADGRDELLIDVRDYGPGIPEDERQRIFDMFYSVERGDCGRQGTGLGLAITRGMIGAHGGEVEAMAGDDGRGTLIRLHLPLLHPTGATPEPAAERGDEHEPETRSGPRAGH